MADSRRPLSVLVVDDSAVVRESMTAVLTRDPKIRVTVASDPLIAMNRMKTARPDVIVLDLEMPRMHGLVFLRKIMADDPIPVVVCSSFTAKGSDAAVRALEAGAVDVVGKPELGVRDFVYDSASMLIEAVRAASVARVRKRGAPPTPPPPPPTPVRPPQPAAPSAGSRPMTSRPPPPPTGAAGAAGAVSIPRLAPGVASRRIIAIGASTGGTEAIRELLEAMPPDAPGILIVQHMPPVFTTAFARRLDEICRIQVKEAALGDRVTTGQALIAPGNKHMTVRVAGAELIVGLSDGPPVSGHRPSVDVFFQSVARSAGSSAVGVILTGMGADGAAGMLEMKRAGAHTIAQDEKTCVVFGMPKEAIANGAVDEVLPLGQIGAQMLWRALCRREAVKARP